MERRSFARELKLEAVHLRAAHPMARKHRYGVARVPPATLGREFERNMGSAIILNAATEKRHGMGKPPAWAIVLGLVLLGAIVWIASTALLIIFMGTLIGVALDAGASRLARLLGGHRPSALAVVILVVSALVIGALSWGGTTLVMQFGQIVDVIDTQGSKMIDTIEGTGLQLNGGDGFDIRSLMPNVSALAGGATNAIFSLFGVIGNIVIAVALGIFFAVEPKIYKNGLVSLFVKQRRRRISDVLGKAAAALRWWLLGQGIAMLAIFFLTYVLLLLIGMPYALLLAAQAGVLEFIPMLGPAVAGVVFIIAGFAIGPHMALWAVGVYALLQVVEGNVLQPVVQEQAVRLPAAFSLSFQLLMGALFGMLGIMLAVPIAAAGKVLFEELYIKDVVGGAWTDG